MLATHARVYDGNGHVLFHLDVPATQIVEFTSDIEVAQIVFYSGSLENEAVVGAVEVQATGPITAKFERPND